jgi:hypothetical protein
MKHCLKKLFGISVLTLFISFQVTAGSQASNETVLPLDEVAVLSKKMEQYAADHGARVLIIARVGRPANELPKGVEYTHVSFAVYSNIKTEDGRTVPGYAVHNLYQMQDKPTKSHLVVDFPLDFLAGAYEAKIGVLIPSKNLQQRLLQVINSDVYNKLHNPSYSAISNPYNNKYQNYTEYVLDVINAAIYQTDDIEQLKLNTREYFTAQRIKISPFKLLLGQILMPELKTSDHKGKIKSTTFGSLARYLETNGLVESLDNIHL